VGIASSLSGIGATENHPIDDFEVEASPDNPLSNLPLYPRYGFKREMDEFTFTMKCPTRLLLFGTTREWKQRDSQTVSVSVGVREGCSYKEDLLAA
jgi:hypothetical protein